MKYRIEAEEDQQGNGGHAATFPLFQRHGSIIIVIDFRHHLLQDLYEYKYVDILYAVWPSWWYPLPCPALPCPDRARAQVMQLAFEE